VSGWESVTAPTRPGRTAGRRCGRRLDGGWRKGAAGECGREPGGDAEGGLRASDRRRGQRVLRHRPEAQWRMLRPQQLPLPSTALPVSPHPLPAIARPLSRHPATTSCHPAARPRGPCSSRHRHHKPGHGYRPRIAAQHCSTGVPWLTKAAAAPVNEGDWGRGRSTSDCDPRPEQSSRPAATPSGASRAGSPRRRSRSSRSTPVVRYRIAW
jgi:hypothetical protein